MRKILFCTCLVLFVAAGHATADKDDDDDDFDDFETTCDFADCEFNCQRAAANCAASCCNGGQMTPPSFPLSCPANGTRLIVTCDQNQLAPFDQFLPPMPGVLTFVAIGAQGEDSTGALGQKLSARSRCKQGTPLPCLQDAVEQTVAER